MKEVRLPDLSGPPVWWDVGVLVAVAAGVIGTVHHHMVVRHSRGRHTP